MEVETIGYWESQKNRVFLDRNKYPTDTEMSEDEFNKLSKDNSVTWGVDLAGRTRFLVENGYDITHDNLINWEGIDGRPDLVAIPEFQQDKSVIDAKDNKIEVVDLGKELPDSIRTVTKVGDTIFTKPMLNEMIKYMDDNP